MKKSKGRTAKKSITKRKLKSKRKTIVKIIRRKTNSKKAPKVKSGAKSRKKTKPTTKKAMDQMLKTDRLVSRGKSRGFVTFDEILKEFPTIETDVMFLDELY